MNRKRKKTIADLGGGGANRVIISPYETELKALSPFSVSFLTIHSVTTYKGHRVFETSVSQNFIQN